MTRRQYHAGPRAARPVRGRAAVGNLTLFDFDDLDALEAPERPHAPTRYGAWGIARRCGHCTSCGICIARGDTIRGNGGGRVLCEPCGADGTHPIQDLKLAGEYL